MLNLNQAIEIKESILAYLKATFNFQDKEVYNAFYDFINNPNEGLFKGPYLSLKLPFVKANEEDLKKIPLTIKPTWLPYDHQVKSWHRLNNSDGKAKPTIITTGTGSGKTESFMYPILDYCYHNLHKIGIKVIILYPMNALATDQAKRLAEAIYEDDRLKDKISAGLFIGEGKNSVKYPKIMGPDHIIENRDSILASPPDILLTNFKMLDYGLMKSNYHDLWLGNFKDNRTLKFLVLDELHTYDGAQGTDVANLIRRLKLKLSIPKNHLCPIGTSATIGTGIEAPELLSDYASKIFGEKIDEECIIIENRLNVDDYFSKDGLDNSLPEDKILHKTKPLTGEGYENYISRQLEVWNIDSTNLTTCLFQLQIVRDIVKVVNTGSGIKTLEEIQKKLSDINKTFRSVAQWDGTYKFSPKEAIVISLLALITEAKVVDPITGRKSPFLYSQTQLWVRELSGLLRVVSENPNFAWKEDIDQSNSYLGLPPWFCRDCGASGWLGVKHDNKERFEKDITDVYNKYFTNHKHIYFINRTSWFSQLDVNNTGYEASDTIQKCINNSNFELEENKHENSTNITAFRKLDNNSKNDHVCPECNTKNTVSIIGTRIATLSSISVSQTLSTDLDEQDEKDRKLLSFTNSVQDAAHQAGFIEARNYRFTFRSSLQKIINDFNKPVSLDSLSKEFIKYWKNNSDNSGKSPLDAYYYRFFPSDYIGKSTPDDYKNHGSYDKHFIEEFDYRIIWEIYSEFGYNAIIGRTLEKTGSSGIIFDDQSLENVWELMEPWLKINDPSGTISRENFLLFLNLLLHRIRTRGAISHPFLNKFRENKRTKSSLFNLNWTKDSRHFLNKRFGPRSRIPKLLTYEKEKRGLLDSTYTKRSNWFHQYYKKSFKNASGHLDMINDFYKYLLESMLKANILDVKNENEDINFALNPKKILVSNYTLTYECDICGNQINVSHTHNSISNSLCLAYRCNGTYKLIEKNIKDNYYQLVYNRNRSPRIYAADHTGLLERKDREILESDFKTRPKFNSVNAMVATSTLEMGIDIGNLNTAFNNSIPPLPSNFLQRIGRAGRASGSALIINFAKSQAHDLFYFKDPMEMMAGIVNTPGCYIEAKEILKRHYFAYCIDSWTMLDPKENTIPINLKYLRLENQGTLSPDFFMNRLLKYIVENSEELYTNFKKGYLKDINVDILQQMKMEMISEEFYNFYKHIFIKIRDEILNLEAIQKDIKQRIIDLKLGKNDNERIELENEIRSLGGIILSIKKRNTLEHLTNVGALPNYAFPETGVTLAAKILGNKPTGSTKSPSSPKDYEIVRPSSQAIREFAPDNYFYSQGYRFLISGVNTFDWSDKDHFHKKRFCSNCDHIEVSNTSVKGGCPKCGDDSWSASSNVHTYVKLLSVKSFNNKQDARLKDSSENRDNIFFNVIRHFNFKESISYGSFSMREIPFGIEFIKNVSIIESNLGRSDSINARKIKISEKEVPAHGFVTCNYCGKSSSKIEQAKYNYHYAYCKHKDKQYQGKEDDIFKEVFFFREIKTEILKILLPVQEFNSESELKMFQAGIELGLKKFFKGNPQHIKLSSYREYNNTSNKFDRYLVLYDTIPGGTSYLEKLFDENEFSTLLKIAYNEIRDCGCQFHGKDGCYHCIYSYSNQFYQLDLSRSLAEKRFYEIYKRSEDWEKQTIGLGELTNTGKIEESELEERFIRSLKLFTQKNENWIIEEVNLDGIITYDLIYQSINKKISYHIRPQANLGPNDNVKYYTRSDFLMVCKECIINGSPLDDILAIPKIAIYLDGYQYHASNDHNNFNEDYKKRRAIVDSGNHYTWTLTWYDLDVFDASISDNKENIDKADYLNERLKDVNYAQSRNSLLKATRRSDVNIDNLSNNFSRLIELLEQTYNIETYRKDVALYFSFFQKKLFTPSYANDNLTEAFEQAEFDNYCIRNRTLDGLIPISIIEDNELYSGNVVVNIERSEIFYDLFIKENKDIDKNTWNSFWNLFNLLQFFEMINSSGDSDMNQILSYSEFNNILNEFESKFHPILTKMYLSGHLKNEEDEIGLNCLISDSRDIIAEAEFINQNAKIAVEPYSMEDKQMFIRQGFTIIDIDQLNEIEL